MVPHPLLRRPSLGIKAASRCHHPRLPWVVGWVQVLPLRPLPWGLRQHLPQPAAVLWCLPQSPPGLLALAQQPQVLRHLSPPALVPLHRPPWHRPSPLLLVAWRPLALHLRHPVWAEAWAAHPLRPRLLAAARCPPLLDCLDHARPLALVPPRPPSHHPRRLEPWAAQPLLPTERQQQCRPSGWVLLHRPSPLLLVV